MLYHPHCSEQQPPEGAVLFFGGDVQDLEEEQAKHRDNRRYLPWCLEETTALLARAFPTRAIFTIRPARMELKTFSCYDNFVECDKMGSPLREASGVSHGTLSHLHNLLQETVSILGLEERILAGLFLVGFSKGVVVLNQILYELQQTDPAGRPTPISCLVWLDGGHNGGPGSTWVTDRAVLAHLASSGIRVRVRVTPYQVQDQRRPWIGKEERAFSRILSDASPAVDFERRLYFAEEEPSIENHFRILDTLVTDPIG